MYWIPSSICSQKVRARDRPWSVSSQGVPFVKWNKIRLNCKTIIINISIIVRNSKYANEIITRLWRTLVKVQTIGTVKASTGMERRKTWNITRRMTYSVHMPATVWIRLLMRRLVTELPRFCQMMPNDKSHTSSVEPINVRIVRWCSFREHFGDCIMGCSWFL